MKYKQTDWCSSNWKILGYKFNWTSGDKLLSKSIRTDSDSLENSLQSGKEEIVAVEFAKFVQAGLGFNICLQAWCCLPIFCKEAGWLTPSLAAGWWLKFCTHKSKTRLVMNETYSFVCLIVISAHVLVKVYSLSVFRKSVHGNKWGSILLPSSPIPIKELI